MILSIIMLIVGFFLLIKGADIFVDGSSNMAAHFKISKMIIGLTIVAFGTSAPELAISIKSLLAGSGDIVLGNVIGSNIINILLILGVSSLFHTLNVKNNTVKKELPIVMLFTVLLSVLMIDNVFDSNMVSTFTRSDGVILLLFFSIYIYYLISMMRNRVNDDIDTNNISVAQSSIFIVLGLIGIVFGSNLVVDSATKIAHSIGISERLISLTIIAFGTSLPELVTSIMATVKGEYDIAIGNVVGSNIFNIGIVLGLPIAIFGGIGHIAFNYLDLIIMLLASILLFVFSFNDRKLTKIEGVVMLLIFTVYYTYIIVG